MYDAIGGNKESPRLWEYQHGAYSPLEVILATGWAAAGAARQKSAAASAAVAL